MHINYMITYSFNIKLAVGVEDIEVKVPVGCDLGLWQNLL